MTDNSFNLIHLQESNASENIVINLTNNYTDDENETSNNPHCALCDTSDNDNSTDDNATSGKQPPFNCELCNFSCFKQSNYNSHLLTKKHKTRKKEFKIKELQKKKELQIMKKNYESKFLCKCGKKYKFKQGLWVHKQTCTYIPPSHATNEIIPPPTANEPTTNVVKFDETMLESFMTIMKQNHEFKELMIEQTKQTQEFQKQLIEIAKEGRNTVINNLNTTNNSFNLHVYLNETCKDAINLLDYVNSLNLTLTDLEETGNLGYSDGMSRIFINGLKDMDVHLRPIHCSDLKREVLYIKEDNVWGKDNENRDKIKTALRMIEKKNIMQIPLWIKAHPNCVISSNRENTPYLKMVMQSTGGENRDATADMAKIITNIAKAVVINKSHF
jgi:hypothetical protein